MRGGATSSPTALSPVSIGWTISDKQQPDGVKFKVPVTDDRRGVELVLLDSGMALVNKASHLHVQGVREHLIDLLDPQQFAALTNYTRPQLLKKILQRALRYRSHSRRK
mgnify:CR=1 FL=1